MAVFQKARFIISKFQCRALPAFLVDMRAIVAERLQSGAARPGPNGDEWAKAAPFVRSP